MRWIRSRLMLATLTGACLLMFLSASATASRGLVLSPGRGGGAITAISQRLVMRGTINVTCELTLRGEFTSDSFLKSSAGRSPEGLFGKFTEGRTANCRESFGLRASVTVLASAASPILFRYDGYLGTLPASSGITISLFMTVEPRGFTVGIRINVLGGGVSCLFSGILPARIGFPPAGGANAGSFVPPNSLTLHEGAESCPRTAEVDGTFRLTPGQELRLQA